MRNKKLAKIGTKIGTESGPILNTSQCRCRTSASFSYSCPCPSVPHEGNPPAQKQTFSNAITSNSMQGLIQKSLKDAKAVARFTSTLISVVNASEQLKACDPGTIVAAALRGEGMGLNLNIGYYLVPYGQTCTFVIGYTGWSA